MSAPPKTFTLEISPSGCGLILQRGFVNTPCDDESFYIVAVLKNRPLPEGLGFINGLLCRYDEGEKALDLALYTERKCQWHQSRRLEQETMDMNLVIDGQAAIGLELRFRIFLASLPAQNNSCLRLSGLGLNQDYQLMSGDISGGGSHLPGPFAGSLLIPWKKIAGSTQRRLGTEHEKTKENEEKNREPVDAKISEGAFYLQPLYAKFYELWILRGQPKVLRLSEFNDLTACLTVISAITLPKVDIQYIFPRQPAPAPWRRLAQNLQLRQIASPGYDGPLEVDLAATLEDYLPLIQREIAEVKMHISKIGVVPDSLWEN